MEEFEKDVDNFVMVACIIMAIIVGVLLVKGII